MTLRFAPASLLAAYCLWRRKGRGEEAHGWDSTVAIGAWIALLGFLPYWFWPDTGSRYVMPLYPLAAFLIAHVLWRQDLLRMRLVVNCLLADDRRQVRCGAVGLSCVSARVSRRLRRGRSGGRGAGEGARTLRIRRLGHGLERRGQHRRSSLPATTVAVAAAAVDVGIRAVERPRTSSSATSFASSRWAASALPAVPRRGVRGAPPPVDRPDRPARRRLRASDSGPLFAANRRTQLWRPAGSARIACDTGA